MTLPKVRPAQDDNPQLKANSPKQSPLDQEDPRTATELVTPRRRLGRKHPSRLKPPTSCSPNRASSSSGPNTDKYLPRTSLRQTPLKKMAPGYRPGGQSRRNNNRGYVDHDVFEGLPVTNWRRGPIHINQTPPQTNEINPRPRTGWDPDYPRSMPKDYHLLPQHSQDLLRAARSGKLYKRPSPAEDEEGDADVPTAEKPEKREADPADQGFQTVGWKPVPKHLEGPEFEYLAKRRKGLRGSAIKPVLIPGPTITKATIRRLDAEGNAYVEDVVVAEGQSLEGEVISKTVVPDPAIVPPLDGLAPNLTPQKRRVPPPKRKSKPKGRKKRAPAPTSVPGSAGPVNSGGVAQATVPSTAGIDGVKSDAGTAPTDGSGDTVMGDTSIPPSDDEGDEGDEGDDGEDGEEGEDDGTDDGQDNEGEEIEGDSPLPKPSIPAITDHETAEVPTAKENSISPDRPLSNIGRHMGEGLGGSPLKKVVTPPAPEADDGDAEAEGDDDHEIHHHDMHMDEAHEESHRLMHGEPQSYLNDEHETYHMPQYMDNGHHDFQPMMGETGDMLRHGDMDDEGDVMLLDEHDDMLLDGDEFSGPIGFDDVEAHDNVYDNGEEHHMPEDIGTSHEEESENFGDLLAGLDDHLNAVDHLHQSQDSVPEVLPEVEEIELEIAEPGPVVQGGGLEIGEPAQGGLAAAEENVAEENAAVSGAAVSDAAVPEAAVSEAAVSEAAVSEAAVPDAAVSDSALSDAAVPEAALSDAAAPEAVVPEAAAPEAAVSDSVLSDAALSDDAVPEVAVSDAAVSQAELHTVDIEAAGNEPPSPVEQAETAVTTEGSAPATMVEISAQDVSPEATGP